MIKEVQQKGRAADAIALSLKKGDAKTYKSLLTKYL